ncbi:hypothetical protein [Streptomyces sp. NPDC091215]|uniref:hypothetical protein n=1 Tax=Streptomyces sp. NPDC091215 TaxID=3155192 RepID=UPI0034146AEA
MTQYQSAPSWLLQDEQFVLPHDLRGPFIREFAPQATYRHRNSQVASVLYYKNGGYSVITVRGAEHHNKPLMGNPTSVCWIARGRHQVSFQLMLPTHGDRSWFRAGADVNWEVHDFYLAAEKRVVDVERMLRPSLEARLRGLSRRYSLDSAQQVDEAIQDELASGRWSDFGVDLGLVTQVFVRIDLGQAAAGHQMQTVAVEKDSMVQEAIDTVNRARIAANIDDAQRLIMAGEAVQYGHMLALDPSRAHEILGVLQQQAREQRQGALDYLTNLINQGVVQRRQIDDQVQALIDFSRTVSTGVFPNDLPQAPTSLPMSIGASTFAADEPPPTSPVPAANVPPTEPEALLGSGSPGDPDDPDRPDSGSGGGSSAVTAFVREVAGPMAVLVSLRRSLSVVAVVLVAFVLPVALDAMPSGQGWGAVGGFFALWTVLALAGFLAMRRNRQAPPVEDSGLDRGGGSYRKRAFITGLCDVFLLPVASDKPAHIRGSQPPHRTRAQHNVDKALTRAVSHLQEPTEGIESEPNEPAERGEM